MPKIKVNNFKGIYTNSNESTLSLEYAKSTNVEIATSDTLRARGYVEVSKEDYKDSIDYISEVILDNDKLANNSNFKTKYFYNPKYYTLKIYIDGTVEVKGETIKGITTINGTVLRVFNDEGQVYIYTTKGIYWLGRLDRVTNRETTVFYPYPTPFDGRGEFYSEEGIYLIELQSPDRVPNLSISKVYDKYNKQTKVLFLIEKEMYINTGDSLDSRYVVVFQLVDTKTLESIYYEYENKKYDRFIMYSEPLKRPITSTSHITTTYKYGLFYGEPGVERVNIDGKIFSFKRYKLYNIKSQLEEVIKEDLKDNISWDKVQNYPNIEFFYDNPEYTITEANGFDRTNISKTWVILTEVYDNGNEYVIQNSTVDPGGTGTSSFFVYKIDDLSIPDDLSTKVVAWRIYYKHKEEDPYELFYERSFYTKKIPSEYITASDLKGIFASQTMGVADPLLVKPLFEFTDVVNLQGLHIVSYGGVILYPVIGNGKLTTMFYKENAIPSVIGDTLFNVNGTLGIKTYDRVYYVNIVSEDGTLLFTKKDEVGFILKDKYDTVETPDGVVLHTNKGIYLSNGQEIRILSEQINDIVTEGYENSNIFYDTFRGVLWYVNKDIKKIYLFFVISQTWVELGSWYNIESIYIDHNNSLYLVNSDEVIKLDYKDKDCYYTSPETSLDESGYLKKITHINFEYKGEIEIDGKVYNSTNPNTKIVIRDTATHHKRLANRIPLDIQGIGFKLQTGTELYKLEVNFDVEVKRNEYLI